MAASGSVIAASSNAGLPRIAGTNAQPAAPIPTMPMRILAAMLVLRASAGHACEARVNCGHVAEQETSMLTAEQNELLTRIGPGTPCGELMRRYWHPIAAASELEGNKWNKRIRLLGEDLV